MPTTTTTTSSAAAASSTWRLATGLVILLVVGEFAVVIHSFRPTSQTRRYFATTTSSSSSSSLSSSSLYPISTPWTLLLSSPPRSFAPFALAATSTSSSSSAPTTASQEEQEQEQYHFHDFWHKERSHQEVQRHIEDCLAQTDELLQKHFASNGGGGGGSGSNKTPVPQNHNHNHTPQPPQPPQPQHPQQQHQRVEVISAEPPLVLIHKLIPKQACLDLIQAAQEAENDEGVPRLARSTTGAQLRQSQSRTSSTVWLQESDVRTTTTTTTVQTNQVNDNDNDNDDDDDDTTLLSSTAWLLRLLAEQVSLISGMPPECMENLQICRYEPGQEFRLHTDHQESFNELTCRGRLATCLLYLAEPRQGGETWFPGVLGLEPKNNNDKNEDNTNLLLQPTAACSKHKGHDKADDNNNNNGDDDNHHHPPESILVRAQQGSAVFFWNTVEKPGSPQYTPDMHLTTDWRLRHAGLPVVQGEKWICNRWIHPIDFGSGVLGISKTNNNNNNNNNNNHMKTWFYVKKTNHNKTWSTRTTTTTRGC
ncbi:hypothetical protein ACA910_017927 [Epithemia clementina (nom. ined.)]